MFATHSLNLLLATGECAIGLNLILVLGFSVLLVSFERTLRKVAEEVRKTNKGGDQKGE
jgi:hypothetical protein